MTNLRRTGTTSAAVLTGLIATLGITHVVAPEWVQRRGLDVWNFPEVSDKLLKSSAESVRLQDEAQRLRESIEAAEHITSRLIARDLTLCAATDLLEPLMEERTGFKEVVAIVYPSATFRMAVARFLIERVQRADPSGFARLEALLEAEYLAMH